MSIIDSDLEIKSKDARCFRFRNRIISEIMGEVTVRGDQLRSSGLLCRMTMIFIFTFPGRA
jgi:hypothetical protein